MSNLGAASHGRSLAETKSLVATFEQRVDILVVQEAGESSDFEEVGAEISRC